MSLIHEYSSPSIYDCEYGRFTDDFDIFCRSVTKGTALDMACGTGRITLQLTQMGLMCTGIDESKTMLSHAQQKAKNLSFDVSYLHQDMRDFDLNQKFDLITMAGNSFQALLTEEDQKNCLRCIQRHMTKTSLFIMNTRNPTPDEIRTTNHFEHWHNFIDDHNETVQVYGRQVFDPVTGLIRYTTKRLWKTHETVSEIELKFTPHNILSLLLKKAGLKVTELYGGFKREIFHSLHSKDIIVIGRKEP